MGLRSWLRSWGGPARGTVEACLASPDPELRRRVLLHQCLAALAPRPAGPVVTVRVLEVPWEPRPPLSDADVCEVGNYVTDALLIGLLDDADPGVIEAAADVLGGRTSLQAEAGLKNVAARFPPGSPPRRAAESALRRLAAVSPYLRYRHEANRDIRLLTHGRVTEVAEAGDRDGAMDLMLDALVPWNPTDCRPAPDVPVVDLQEDDLVDLLGSLSTPLDWGVVELPMTEERARYRRLVERVRQRVPATRRVFDGQRPRPAEADGAERTIEAWREARRARQRTRDDLTDKRREAPASTGGYADELRPAGGWPPELTVAGVPSLEVVEILAAERLVAFAGGGASVAPAFRAVLRSRRDAETIVKDVLRSLGQGMQFAQPPTIALADTILPDLARIVLEPQAYHHHREWALTAMAGLLPRTWVAFLVCRCCNLDTDSRRWASVYRSNAESLSPSLLALRKPCAARDLLAALLDSRTRRGAADLALRLRLDWGWDRFLSHDWGAVYGDLRDAVRECKGINSDVLREWAYGDLWR